ncbi:hypothetical protein, variant [Aphanomyces invadans]|uniref:Uncharacterized protein n=1 Tax=Aphanomyces invadans TaxID=157072 RepID=A0A024U7W8_9STRA|nr:hypothetical protein, variant [Aphanomyces invadans]ETW01972.1 hypothetical protein, variant [Aphanomyces invadans]|eukprot:XP_008869820.1 hypothetical protein, variant [Aphanomyces invadans]
MADDAEIKRLVTETLEMQGVLSQIKAQLRAAVYNAMHEVAPEPTKVKRDLFASKESSLALRVVVEFLRQFNLHHTLSVLTAEASLTEADLSCTRRDVATSLHWSSLGTSTTALLVDLIHNQSNGARDDKANTPSSIDSESLQIPKKSSEDARSGDSSQNAKTVRAPSLDLKPLKTPNILGFATTECSVPTTSFSTTKPNTSVEPHANDDDGEDDEESIASSVQEATSSVDNASPDKPAARQEAPATDKPSAKLVPEPSKANDLPPLGKPSLLGALPPMPGSKPAASVTTPTPTDGGDDDDQDEDDDAARLRALDASLKAMEAEDDTGTLSKLKASLQHELEAKSDDDGSHYGSDFEEDFEEDAIASDVEEDVGTSKTSDDDGGFKPSAADKPVSRSVLDTYDHVEDVERP